MRSLGVLKLFGRIGEMEALLPTRRLRGFSPPHLGEGARSVADLAHPISTDFELMRRFAKGKRSRSAALFTGCIMRAGFGDIHNATIRVLQNNGWQVSVSDAQICCGALHLHAGERELAKEMARKNIDAFAKGEGKSYNAIIVNAAGCGAVLKEYGELLHSNPVYAQRAQEFSAHVLDVSEALAQSPLQSAKREGKLRVTYQEPCHLAHAQRVKKEPREILNQISGIEFVEMNASDRCCGSAGIYNVLHPEIANQLIDEKMANISATGAEVVVTGNIGCLLQLEYGKVRSGWKGRVMHLVELLDEAHGQ